MCDKLNKVQDVLCDKKAKKVNTDNVETLVKNGELYERINKTMITEDNKILLND